MQVWWERVMTSSNSTQQQPVQQVPVQQMFLTLAPQIYEFLRLSSLPSLALLRQRVHRVARLPIQRLHPHFVQFDDGGAAFFPGTHYSRTLSFLPLSSFFPTSHLAADFHRCAIAIVEHQVERIPGYSFTT